MNQNKEAEEVLRDKFHRAVEKECGPILKRIVSQIYIGKNPDELGQILLKDELVGGLYSSYTAQEAFKQIQDAIGKGKQ